MIDNDLIHRVTILSNEGCNPINIKNVRKTVEANLFIRFDGKNMKVNTIQDNGVRLLSKILGYKFKYGSRIDSIIAACLHVAYAMAIQRKKVNLCEIIRTQLSDNIAKIKKTKCVVFRFESLLTYIFSYIAKRFYRVSN